MSNKPFIMIVDDDKDVANEIAAIVNESNKYSALLANCAKDALDLLREHNSQRYDEKKNIRLILLDIKMPDMDGLEFLEKIRATYPKDPVGVIIISAYQDNAKWEKAIMGHVAGYITKPFDRKALIEKIDFFFSRDEDAPYKMIANTIIEATEKMDD